MKSFWILILTISVRTISGQELKSDTLFDNNELTIIGNKVNRLTGSGEYVSKYRISKYNQTDVNKILRTIPGVNIRDEEGFGLRPNIGMRGTSVNRSSKITLMEDGILMAPAPYSDPSAYYFPTFARMQGVEVLKGSSQIKHGPYTIGGAVNFLSTPVPDTSSGFSQLSYGSFNTNQQRLWAGNSKGHISYVFEFNRLASDGFKKLDNGGNTGFGRRDLMLKIGWKTPENAGIPQSIMLKFLTVSETANESYLGLTYDDFMADPLHRYAATQKDLLNLQHTHYVLSHNIEPIKNFAISTSLYDINTYRNWGRVNSIDGKSLNTILSNPSAYNTQYGIMTGSTDGPVVYQNSPRKYLSRGVQIHVGYRFITKAIHHYIQLGSRYHTDRSDRYATQLKYQMNQGKMVLTDSGLEGNAENQVRDASSISGYINYELNFKGLTVSTGLRYESVNLGITDYGLLDPSRQAINARHAENTVSVLLPGLGINYQYNKAISVFGGIHKGFSPPGPPVFNADMQQAQPETALNYEMGLRYSGQNVNIKLTGFSSAYGNILGSDNVSGGGAGSGNMFNAGNATVQGIELAAGYDIMLKKGWEEIKLPIKISYTFTRAKFLETFVNGGGDWGSGVIYAGDIIPFVTPHLLTAMAGIEKEKWNINLAARYVGTTRIKPSHAEIIVPAENVSYSSINSIAGFINADISANYRTSKYFTLFAVVNNFTNNINIVANLPQAYRPNMPWAINMGVKVHF